MSKSTNSFPNELKQEIYQHIKLSDEERERLKQAVSGFRYPAPEEGYENYVIQARSAVASGLSVELLRQLELIRSSRYGAGTLILHNLPLDDELPRAPASGRRADYHKPTSIAENVLIGVAALLGQPIGHEEEKDGHLVHDIVPVENTDKPLSNEGATDFGLHTENAIFDVREHFVILSCLWPDPYKEAVTPVVDIRAVLPILDEDTIGALRKPQFAIRKPYILDRSEVESMSDPVAILSGPEDSPEIRCTLYKGGTVGLTTEATEALNKLAKVLDAEAQEVRLDKGDMVIVNNYTALHGRRQFRVVPGAYNRHLIRSYVLPSLWQVRHMQCIGLRIINRSKA